MSEIIVEVNVENGLPGTMWRVKRDPRYLLAVVHALKGVRRPSPDGDKFVARWNEGFVELEIPDVDGDYHAFMFVLIETLESMAKVLIEIEWGASFLGATMAQKKIATPKLGGPLVL